MMPGSTSGLKPTCCAASSHFSGRISGKSEPNSIFFFSGPLAYWMICGWKYFGLQPERSRYTFSLCNAIDRLSSTQGQLGWASTIFMSGKSTATSSISIGWPHFRRTPPPPGSPDRKSTRLNSSHSQISYAVFCLKKKKKKKKYFVHTHDNNHDRRMCT